MPPDLAVPTDRAVPVTPSRSPGVPRAARVELLDGFTVTVGQQGRQRELPHGVQRLLAHLCLYGRAPRSTVAGTLWPEADETSAQGSLRSALWRLQREAPGLVEVAGSSLRVADDVSLDVRELAQWATALLDPVVDSGPLRTPDVALRGELLPGWYDDWVLLERERLRQLRLHALEVLAFQLSRERRWGEALQAAHAAVRTEPLRESAHRVIVRVHLAEGNVAEAVRSYLDFAELLATELGVVPTAQMRELMPRVGMSSLAPGRRGLRAPAG